MPKKDPRIDAYIEKSASFAKPILTHVRKLVHAACPEVEETVKWGMPHFDYKGGMLGMAAFKQHCAVSFWKSKLIFDNAELNRDGMGHLGRITSIADLPNDKTLTRYLKKAVELNEAGIKNPRPARSTKRGELVVPEVLLAALRKNKKALTTFENFTYSHKKEYVEWITEAKREETREHRLETTMKLLTQGKTRHSKYQ
jgi:uncharacterized protein YdeI (YjbR/CyaY-like superfamily)